MTDPPFTLDNYPLAHGRARNAVELLHARHAARKFLARPFHAFHPR